MEEVGTHYDLRHLNGKPVEVATRLEPVAEGDSMLRRIGTHIVFVRELQPERHSVPVSILTGIQPV